MKRLDQSFHSIAEKKGEFEFNMPNKESTLISDNLIGTLQEVDNSAVMIVAEEVNSLPSINDYKEEKERMGILQSSENDNGIDVSSLSKPTLNFVDLGDERLIKFLQKMVDYYSTVKNNENDFDVAIMSAQDNLKRDYELRQYKDRELELMKQINELEKSKLTADIKLKMIKNEMAVMKITSEQQVLAVETEKISLIHQAKDLKQENTYLRSLLDEQRKLMINDIHSRCNCKSGGKVETPAVDSKPKFQEYDIGSIESSLKLTTLTIPESLINQTMNSVSTISTSSHTNTTNSNHQAMLVSATQYLLSAPHFLSPSLFRFLEIEYSPVLIPIRYLIDNYGAVWNEEFLKILNNAQLSISDPDYWKHRTLEIVLSLNLAEFYSETKRQLIDSAIENVCHFFDNFIQYIQKLYSSDQQFLTLIQDVTNLQVTIIEYLSKQKSVRYLFGIDSFLIIRVLIFITEALIMYLFRRKLFGIILACFSLLVTPILFSIFIILRLICLIIPKRKQGLL
jgi:hypothetical protein